QLGGLLLAAHPEQRPMTGARRLDGYGGSERPGAQHADRPHRDLLRPSRRSVPANSLCRLPRCFRTTTDAVAEASARAIGGDGAIQPARANSTAKTGTESAARIEPTET